MIGGDPVACDEGLDAVQADVAGAEESVQTVLEDVLAVQVSPRVIVRFGPEVANRIAATQLERDEVVNLVLAGRAVGNAVLRIDLVLFGFGDVADAGGVSGSTDRHDGNAKRGTRRHA